MKKIVTMSFMLAILMMAVFVTEGYADSVEDDKGELFSEIWYPGKNPSNRKIDQWRSDYEARLRAAVTPLLDGFRVDESLMNEHPGLVFLIMKSETIDTAEQKQEWFDLCIQHKEQLYKLYRILLTEQHKLAKIEEKYKKKNEQILKKYQK